MTRSRWSHRLGVGYLVAVSAVLAAVAIADIGRGREGMAAVALTALVGAVACWGFGYLWAAHLIVTVAGIALAPWPVPELLVLGSTAVFIARGVLWRRRPGRCRTSPNRRDSRRSSHRGY